MLHCRAWALAAAAGHRQSLCHTAITGQVLEAAAAQRGAAVFSTSAVRGGPIKTLDEEVTSRFKKMAVGRPPNISAAQLVQMIFEVGAADLKHAEASDVLNTLILCGFYKRTHSKRDSYGPAPVPTVGLDECKHWATTIFLDTVKRQKKRAAAAAAAVAAAGGKDIARFPLCRVSWCQCPVSTNGKRTCVLQSKARSVH
mmetsp:Transcript_72726/g.168533  ORF Transcript_72726/g.168533 Transcript_72726/m.168533 type:complete len:199 (-) Transcript_72726:106-702(-)